MPFPVILSAPSGAGKTTIARKLLTVRTDLAYSISATTRPRRAHETHGVDYFFLTDAEFALRRDAGDFAEFAEVHGCWYGTLRAEVDGALEAGNHVVMDIDVQGARQFRRLYDKSVLVFVLPPSLETLLARLEARKTESAETLRRRMRTALKEIEAIGEYRYVVVNDKLDVATQEVSAIIDAEMANRVQSPGFSEPIAALIGQLRRDILAKAQEF